MTDLWSMMGGCDSVSTVDALLASGCSLDELFDDLHVLLELRSNTRVEDLTARITAHIFLRDNNYAARFSTGCADGCARAVSAWKSLRRRRRNWRDSSRAGTSTVLWGVHGTGKLDRPYERGACPTVCCRAAGLCRRRVLARREVQCRYTGFLGFGAGTCA